MQQPERAVPDAFTAHVRAVVRRIRAADLLGVMAWAGGAGLVTVAAALLAGTERRGAWLFSIAAAAAVLVARLITVRRSWTLAAGARRLEHARPESRNVIVTAEELLRRPERARDQIRARVVREALHAAQDVRPAAAVPLARPAALFMLAIAAWAAGAVGLPRGLETRVRDAAHAPGEEAGGTALPRVVATLTPPAYLQAPAERVDEPERLAAVTGTRLSITLRGGGDGWRIRLGAAGLETTRTAAGTVGEAVLEESSYLAIEGPAGGENGRRLIPVIVTPDRTPTIRIEQPAKDLRLPEASRTIPVSAAAADDFGLASLELRYTKVSGSGEQFEFEEGVIPLRLERADPRAWSGRTALALATLQLQPGDALVYRAVGSDRRPGGAGEASSDTFFVEIAGPDEATLAGFELPPDRERYGLSQQMILLKIRRLRAREARMPREAVREEAEGIAVEQRSVRANFVFLTGGHVEDEEEEAAHSHEIQEGRLEHGARREINGAIGHMSRVEQTLIAGDVPGAIPPARAAVEALQRAFGRNRYFLRTLPVRSRLDPSRRLSGTLDDAADSRRTVNEAEPVPSVRAARAILAGLLEVAAGDPSQADPRRLTALAERALAVDPASEAWQGIAAALLGLRDSVTGAAAREETESRLAAAAGALRVEAARGAVPSMPADPRSRALSGAWASEAVRR